MIISVGDLAYRNKNGFIVLVDGKIWLFLVERIFILQVENILGKHNAVKDLAIVGAKIKNGVKLFVHLLFCIIKWS